jgi:hypothetical protein
VPTPCIRGASTDPPPPCVHQCAGGDRDSWDRLYCATIDRRWGVRDLDSTSPDTLQGVDYVHANCADDFGDAWFAVPCAVFVCFPLSLVTSRAVPRVLVCFALSLVTPRAVLCVRVCVPVGLFVRRRFVRRRGNHGLPEPRASLYCPSMMAAGFRARWFSLLGSSLAVPLLAPAPLDGCFARKVLGCFSCQPVCLGWWLCCPCSCRPNAGAARRSVGSMARTRNLRCVDDYPFFRSAVAATLRAALDAMVHDGALPALRVSVRACRWLCCACCVRAWLL